MRAMTPKGRSTIPIPELSITACGDVVLLMLLSLAGMVTVMNVALDVTLSLGVLKEEAGSGTAAAVGARNVVLVSGRAMVSCFNCMLRY